MRKIQTKTSNTMKNKNIIIILAIAIIALVLPSCNKSAAVKAENDRHAKTLAAIDLEAEARELKEKAAHKATLLRLAADEAEANADSKINDAAKAAATEELNSKLKAAERAAAEKLAKQNAEAAKAAAQQKEAGADTKQQSPIAAAAH